MSEVKWQVRLAMGRIMSPCVFLVNAHNLKMLKLWVFDRDQCCVGHHPEVQSDEKRCTAPD